jgi:hypothetical protein
MQLHLTQSSVAKTDGSSPLQFTPTARPMHLTELLEHTHARARGNDLNISNGTDDLKLHRPILRKEQADGQARITLVTPGLLRCAAVKKEAASIAGSVADDIDPDDSVLIALVAFFHLLILGRRARDRDVPHI